MDLIAELGEWFTKNATYLAASGISVTIGRATSGLPKNSVYVDLESNGYEVTVQLWESGESDFHIWPKVQDAIEVRHFVFFSAKELDAALAHLVSEIEMPPEA